MPYRTRLAKNRDSLKLSKAERREKKSKGKRKGKGEGRRGVKVDSRRLGGLGPSPAAGATHDDDDEGAALSTLKTRKRLMAKPESQPGA